MVIIAGHIAGRRGRGLRRAPWSATAGVAVGTIITLGGLLLLRVIAMQPRVVVPLGGMIVSGAMLAAGLTLRRLREDAEQARPAIEARLCLGLSARYQTLPSRKAARMDGLPVHIGAGSWACLNAVVTIGVAIALTVCVAARHQNGDRTP